MYNNSRETVGNKNTGGINMPYISIKTKTSIARTNLEELNKNIAQEMGIDRGRIVISWEIFCENGFYKHGDQNIHHQPVVIIKLSKRNGEEFAKKLATIVVDELCRVLNIPKEEIMLLIHRIEVGDIYLNGEFV